MIRETLHAVLVGLVLSALAGAVVYLVWHATPPAADAPSRGAYTATTPTPGDLRP